jgi:hypothetical protein
MTVKPRARKEADEISMRGRTQYRMLGIIENEIADHERAFPCRACTMPVHDVQQGWAVPVAPKSIVANVRRIGEEPMTTKAKTAAGKRRKSNIVPFPKTIDPEHKENIQEATGIFEALDAIFMRSLRKQLAEAETKATLGDLDAKDDAEFFRLSIARRLRDQDSIRSNTITAFARVRAVVKARA